MHNIKCQDNLEFIQAIDDESVQLIITSPPYNIGKAYENKAPLDEYIENQSIIINECIKKLKPGGSICWQVGNYVNKGEIIPLDILLYPIFANAGLKLRNRIVWHFSHGLHCKKRFSGRYETILWFTKTDDYVFNLDPVRIPQKWPGKKHFKGAKKGELSCNPLGKNPSDIWDIGNVKHNHPEKTNHPCQFPLELVDRLVLSLSNEGDIVFDPYLGSGTTALSAVNNNRIGVGCDILPEYIEIALSRLKQGEKNENS